MRLSMLSLIEVIQIKIYFDIHETIECSAIGEQVIAPFSGSHRVYRDDPLAPG